MKSVSMDNSAMFIEVCAYIYLYIYLCVYVCVARS